jgi:hypothetical protein
MKTTIHTLLHKTVMLGAVFLLTAGASVKADTNTNNWYISTYITTAQTQIDTNHLSSWIITANTNVNIWGGNFVMKDGPKTDASLTFSLYFGALTPTDLFSGTNGAALITNVVLSNAEFKIQNPNDQQYNPVIFQFTDNLGSNAPLTLSNGVTYTAALTSPALDKASYQYFIKGGDALLSTTNNPPIVNTNDISNVPEPATYILMGLGALLLLISYKGRRAE